MNQQTMRLSTCLLLLLPIAALLHAQRGRDATWDFLMKHATGMPSLGDSFVGLARDAAEMRALKANMAARLAVARENFWTSWPDKPAFAKARQELSALLRSKDHLKERGRMGELNRAVVTGIFQENVSVWLS
ncbi:MAG TPA: hypothetical protein VGH22_05505 [Candidatus Binatia bacterium]